MAAADDETKIVIPGDNPITSAKDDALERLPMAEVLASEIRLLDASEGYVVGILGPWGSGKTSLINLVKSELAKSPAIPVLEFNPWMFSGADELVQSFFFEISAQLRERKDRLAAIAVDIEAYADVVAPLRYLPVIGVWIERVRGGSKALKQLAERRRGGLTGTRRKVVEKLKALDQPIVVVVDDIDRLRTQEIRDIFKLVRLTANFPNVIYLLAFDRERVEQALTEDHFPGREYLEKILQLTYDVPAIADDVMWPVLTKELDRVLEAIATKGPWQPERWPDIGAEIVWPLVKNMRDVRRYIAAVHATVRGIGDHVALVDVLALEAVRVFLPDVFRLLPRAHAGLTSTRDIGYGMQEPPQLKQSVEALLEAAGSHQDIVRAMIRRLFPAALRHIENNSYGSDWLKSWLRKRLVAHPDILQFYLQRVAGSGLRSFLRAEQAFAVLNDQDLLGEFLDALPETEVEDVIARLEVYEGEFPEAAVAPACVVLLNRLERMPEQDRGMFSLGPRMVVARVVLRMLRQIEDEVHREAVVREVLPQLTSLSARRELLRLVGYEEDSGHKLIPETAVCELDRALREEVRAASAQALASEGELLRLLWWARKTSGDDEPAFELPAGDGLAVALLRGAVTETKSQPVGSRAVSRAQRLAWDLLVSIVGGDEAVASFLTLVEGEAGGDPELSATVDLAKRYASGWRPPEFG